MSLWGYGVGEMVEARVGDEWKACKVTSIVRRGVLVRPLTPGEGPWRIDNPARLRQMSQEAFEAWLEAE